MVLIKCKECGKDISDSAASCPSCGNPNKIKVVLTEQTSKKWKIIKLIGGIITAVGIYFFFSGYAAGGFKNGLTIIGFNLSFVGIVIFIIGKIGAWWSHK